MFELVPFEPVSTALGLTLTGTCSRPGTGLAMSADFAAMSSNTGSEPSLQLLYQLEGNLDAVVIPEPSPTPTRGDGLWQSTCFECFFAKPGQDAYWEMNLSPCGDWNVYQLQGYRAGLCADPRFTAISHQVEQSARRLAISLTIPLPAELADAPQLDLAICAVIALRDGSTSYWALRHCAPEADFHRRESFALGV